jgi:hypothetical protein
MKLRISLFILALLLFGLPVYAVEDETEPKVPETELVTDEAEKEDDVQEEVIEDVLVESTETEVENNFVSKEYDVDGSDKENYLVEGGNEEAINNLATKQNQANGTIVESVNVSGLPYNLTMLSDEEKEKMKSLELRQFVSFETKSGKVFHLIIDHSKETDNVQMLTEVGEQDLLNLIEENADIELILNETENVEVKKTTQTKRETSNTNDTNIPVSETQNNLNLIVIIVASVLAGILGWYFKIYKPKKEMAFDDEVDEADYIDEDEFVKEEETN